MSEWPAWATEPIRIENWNPLWADHAAELVDSLQDLLQELIDVPIHCRMVTGSTGTRRATMAPDVRPPKR